MKVTIKKIVLDINIKANKCKLIMEGSDKKNYTLITDTDFLGGNGRVGVAELE